MSHSPVDWIVVFGTDATVAVPGEGNTFYGRSCDGAIGRRQSDVMFWFVGVGRDVEAIATRSVDEDVLEVDELIGELAARGRRELPQRSRAIVKTPRGGNDERTRRENRAREGRSLSSAARPTAFSSPPRETDAEAVKR